MTTHLSLLLFAFVLSMHRPFAEGSPTPHMVTPLIQVSKPQTQHKTPYRATPPLRETQTPTSSTFSLSSRHALYTSHKKHLSKPYQHMQYHTHIIRYKNHTVVRKNHGIMHAVRVTSYLKPIYDTLCQQPQKNKTLIVENKTHFFEKLAIAAAFNVSGREAEIGANNPLYKAYRTQSARNFYHYVVSNPRAFRLFQYDKKKVKVYAKNVIKHRGNANMHANRDIQLASMLLAYAHNIDLYRCKSSTEVRSITKSLDEKIGGSFHAVRHLHTMAKKSILATGSPLFNIKGYDHQKCVQLSASFPGYEGQRHPSPLSQTRAESILRQLS